MNLHSHCIMSVKYNLVFGLKFKNSLIEMMSLRTLRREYDRLLFSCFLIASFLMAIKMVICLFIESSRTF